LAAVVAYAAAGTDRLPEVVGGVGALGWTIAAVALLGKWPSLLPWGLAGVGAGYAVFLGLRTGSADGGAPLVAAGLVVAAELGFWSLESRDAHVERAVLVRRIVLIAASGLGAALVGSLLLVAAAGVSGGVGLEAVGVLAAVLTLAIVAVLAARSSSSTSGS
jgi:hypothetical protein